MIEHIFMFARKFILKINKFAQVIFNRVMKIGYEIVQTLLEMTKKTGCPVVHRQLYSTEISSKRSLLMDIFLIVDMVSEALCNKL